MEDAANEDRVHGAASVDPREQGCRWEPRGSPTYGAWPPRGGPDGTPLYWGGGRFVVSLLVNLLVIIEYSGIDWLVN